MAEATLERDGTSVSIPLREAGSGAPLVIRGLGKPNLQIQNTGAINPRSLDQWSGLEQYTLSGRFDGGNAYTDAITLIDLIKSNSNGNQLILNIDMPDYDTDIPVAPAAGQDAALSISYPSSWRNSVRVDVALTRAETIAGGDQPATTPTASGSGPIQLSDGTTTVSFTSGLEVERSVGRPQSVIRRRSNSQTPIHIDKFKTAADTFELSFEFTEDTVSKTNQLVSLFANQLGRDSLTLDFQGLYGLGAFDVVPDGSEAIRHNRQSGYKSSGLIPSVNLRRVFSQ